MSIACTQVFFKNN